MICYKVVFLRVEEGWSMFTLFHANSSPVKLSGVSYNSLSHQLLPLSSITTQVLLDVRCKGARATSVYRAQRAMRASRDPPK